MGSGPACVSSIVRRLSPMDTKAILIQAIRSGGGLPAVMREHADKVSVCESETFGEDYFSYLDSEIQKFSTKDPDTARQFQKRRAAFLPFRDTELLQGSIWTDDAAFNFWVDPKTIVVIYWHEWDNAKFKLAREMIQLSQKLKALEQQNKS